MIGDAVGGLDVSSAASLVSFYTTLDKVMRLAVNQRVEDFDIAFAAGLFSKTDYLAKQLRIDKTVAHLFNQSRDRIRRIGNKPVADLDREELLLHWPHDLKAVACFISVIYGDSPIPASLSSRFPLSPLQRAKGKLMATKMRVAVERVEGDIIFAAAEADGDELRIRCSSAQQYLLPLLSAGCQLNLIAPRKSTMAEETLEAEHIILHPDLLINITSVAACFEEYATDAKIFLFNKISPPANSPAIILGNFAGKMLDDAIHHRSLSYNDSILRFCRENALSMAACASQLGDSFHAQAQEQMRHIRHVIDSVMPREVRGFNSREVMLEPSFLCEMLGIQGRMDMLQLDFKVLVEQKSGKGLPGFGNRPGEQPRQKTRHYVQLLLYMAVLHYNFKIPYSDIYSFLLYSKYDRSLLQLGSAPELLRKAIEIRNQIAWMEYLLASDGFSIYEKISPESIKVDNRGRSFFEQYIRPQFKSLLSPIHSASETEKAYFRRFMTFIQMETILARTGTKTRDDNGFAQIWLSTAREKAEAGTIYYGLSIDPQSFQIDDIGAVEFITLLFPDADAMECGAGISNFRVGDTVVVYPYPERAQPYACSAMVHRATIADITLRGVRLGLRNPQTDRHVFERDPHSLWAVEHDGGDASASGLFNGVCSMLTAPLKRRQLLLSQRDLEHGDHVALNGDYGAFNDLVARAMQARDLFLVIGPPGTGKTSFAMLNILREELSHSEASVLLMSYTNRAVDEMCGKLVEAGIDFIRIGNSVACDPQYRSHMIEEKVENCNTLSEMAKLINGARVVCATVSTVNTRPELLAMRHFSLAIVDEASQILEPYIVGPLCAVASDGVESIARFVLIGDHKQLPAVVLQSGAESKVSDPLLNSLDIQDCRHSLFQRLVRRYAADPRVTYMLTHQGRMHSDIALFPSQAFYGGLLQPVPLQHQLRPLESSADLSSFGDLAPYAEILTSHRVAFIDVDVSDNQSPTSDKVNLAEADVIARLSVTAYKLRAAFFDPTTTLGVIVPYRNQIVSIRNAIDKYGIAPLHDITIDTVERFQGSQRDIIIYGFTVRHRYQLDFLTANDFEENGIVIDPKLNVAMTRARENLILVGNKSLLSLDPVFKKLLSLKGEIRFEKLKN